MVNEQTIENLVNDSIRELCLSCSRYADCIYRKRAHKLIIQCELFDDGVEHEDAVTAIAADPIGLCSTCSKLDQCHLRAASGGVWHCEEYE